MIEELSADFIVVATGSRPRVPDFVPVDHERVLTTRDAYPPPEIPEHAIVVGSGVTGVEFTHLFDSLGSKVTLLVSRQQVLPIKDAEVASVLEDAFLAARHQPAQGRARASAVERDGDVVRVRCEDGRVVEGSHALLAVGLDPEQRGHRARRGRASRSTPAATSAVNHNCLSNVSHIYAAGDVSGKLPLSSVAAMQGRKIAEHLMGLHNRPHRHLDYDKAASAVFTDPEIADVGLAEAEAFSEGRKIRVTKVPFTANAKALIKGDPRGFVKILSDPATGVVLGGSIVGRNAAELISVLAVAVTNGLRVDDIVDSLLVHPSLAELLADAASLAARSRPLAPSGLRLHEALDELQRRVGDLLPAVVDGERVAAVLELDDLGDRVLVAPLALERRVADRPRHGVVLGARDDEQRAAVGVLGLDLHLGPRVEVGARGLEEREPGGRDRERVVELVRLVLAHHVGERVAELLVGERHRAPWLRGLRSTGDDERSAEIGSGSTPRCGAGEMATDASLQPRPARISVRSPPNEWPIDRGTLLQLADEASTWSATCCTDLWANTSGWRLASSTEFGSSGQPAVTVEKPAASKYSAHRSQLLGSSHSPCTNTTGFLPDAFACRRLARLRTP